MSSSSSSTSPSTPLPVSPDKNLRQVESVDPIILTNPRILAFFVQYPYIEPTKFILSCINKFDSHLHEDATTHVIKHDSLIKIQQEYNSFIAQKESILNVMRASHKDQLRTLETMNFFGLESYLSKKFDVVEDGGILCHLCKLHKFPTKKSLGAHLRKCKTTIHRFSTNDDDHNDHNDSVVPDTASSSSSSSSSSAVPN